MTVQVCLAVQLLKSLYEQMFLTFQLPYPSLCRCLTVPLLYSLSDYSITLVPVCTGVSNSSITFDPICAGVLKFNYYSS